MANDIRPTRSGLPSLGGLFLPPTRPVEIEEDVPPAGAPRRWRQRIPTREQLASLIQNGRLILPMRYFRGYFLDLLV